MSKIDVISAVRFYVDKIVSDPTIGGKVFYIFYYIVFNLMNHRIINKV